MRHLVSDVAKNFRIDPIALTRFAIRYHNKYGIIAENGKVTTSTSFSDALVKDFETAKEHFYSSLLQIEDLIGSNVMGWTCNVESMSGTVVWSNPNTDHAIYATPHWNKKGEIPFEVGTNDDADNNVLVATIIVHGAQTIEEQKQWYIDTLKTIITNWTK
jgi:hypothetical protein